MKGRALVDILLGLFTAGAIGAPVGHAEILAPYANLTFTHDVRHIKPRDPTPCHPPIA